MLAADIAVIPNRTVAAVEDGPRSPALTLVIPVRDEASTLPSSLDVIARWVRSTHLPVEVLVVDDNSCDGTRAAAESFIRRLPLLRVHRSLEDRGPVESTLTGVQLAEAPVILVGNADAVASNTHVLAELLGSIVEGYDLAVWLSAPPLDAHHSTGDGIADVCMDWIRAHVLGQRKPPPSEPLKVIRTESARRLLSLAQLHGWDTSVPWLDLSAQANLRVSRHFATRRESPRAPA